MRMWGDRRLLRSGCCGCCSCRFSIRRSERLLMEQLQYNLLFRWFVGMEMDEEVWNHAVFSKNRERLLNEEDRKSTRLNSSHGYISYAVFCLKKKKKKRGRKAFSNEKPKALGTDTASPA